MRYGISINGLAYAQGGNDPLERLKRIAEPAFPANRPLDSQISSAASWVAPCIGYGRSCV